jgi:hypothetical protein
MINSFSAASGLFRIAHFGERSIRNPNLSLVAADIRKRAVYARSYLLEWVIPNGTISWRIAFIITPVATSSAPL